MALFTAQNRAFGHICVRDCSGGTFPKGMERQAELRKTRPACGGARPALQDFPLSKTKS